MFASTELDRRVEVRLPAAGDTRLVDLFWHYLTVVQANSADLLDKVFRLRFQVYCQERGFEDAAAYPDGREKDADDARSLHFLVVYRPFEAAAAAAGTVRFILPRPGLELPVFKLIGSARRRSVGLPFESTAEVSRFAVAKHWRRQLERDLCRGRTTRQTADGGARTALPLLTFGLIRAVVMMSAAGGVSHIVAMMEPALLRLLGRLGIEFHPIGGLVDHHGWRQPAWAAMAHLIERVRQHYPELWEFATDTTGEKRRHHPGRQRDTAAEGHRPRVAARELLLREAVPAESIGA